MVIKDQLIVPSKSDAGEQKKEPLKGLRELITLVFDAGTRF